ncbi:MAG TPA: glycosyltransferase, partial [Rhizomicrobium sp.]|nr:glycosyltransferase [Rhizomicrobium sp.]
MTELWLLLSFLSFVAWIYLLIARGAYWLARDRNEGPLPEPSRWPAVTAVVPARNEVDVVSRTAKSLLAQDYPGDFRVILVDDQSDDGTGEAARALFDPRLEILSGSPRPAGWTGKLWAVEQGVARAKANATSDYLWLTDADIAHTPNNLRMLVGRAERSRLVLVSEMAKLHCNSWSERFLVPAFVYFFAMLYPFAWVNDRQHRVAAAAGGSMLVHRATLEAAGGIESIRHEIIDDCALARLMKAHGPIWLGLTQMSQSVRPYAGIGEIGQMIS